MVVEGADGDAEELGNRPDAVVGVGQQVAGLTQQVGVDGVGAPSDAAAGPRGGETNARSCDEFLGRILPGRHPRGEVLDAADERLEPE